MGKYSALEVAGKTGKQEIPGIRRKFPQLSDIQLDGRTFLKQLFPLIISSVINSYILRLIKFNAHILTKFQSEACALNISQYTFVSAPQILNSKLKCTKYT